MQNELRSHSILRYNKTLTAINIYVVETKNKNIWTQTFNKFDHLHLPSQEKQRLTNKNIKAKSDFIKAELLSLEKMKTIETTSNEHSANKIWETQSSTKLCSLERKLQLIPYKIMMINFGTRIQVYSNDDKYYKNK